MGKFIFISFGGRKADILLTVVLNLGCTWIPWEAFQKNTDAWVPPPEARVLLLCGRAWAWGFFGAPGDPERQPGLGCNVRSTL